MFLSLLVCVCFDATTADAAAALILWLTNPYVFLILPFTAELGTISSRISEYCKSEGVYGAETPRWVLESQGRRRMQ